jgi:hypothetical protein
MPERVRRRRDDEERAAESRPAEAIDPRVQRALMLQRSAGNRAVARLVYQKSDKKIHAPQAYVDQRIAWDATKLVSVERDPKPTDPKLGDLATKHPQLFKDWLTSGMNAGMPVEGLSADSTLNATATAMAKTPPDAAPLQQAAQADGRVIKHWTGRKLSQAELAGEPWAMLPRDFIPQENDLPAAGVDVLNTKIGDPKFPKATFWTFVCVLIALYRTEGDQGVEAVIETPVSGLDNAVQAMHDHYAGMNVPLQYDDSSTRFRVMGDFGYSLMFTGPIDFADLPTKMALPAGEYIFDIKGHTVHTTVPNAIPAGARLNNPKPYFVFHSDNRNYSEPEIDKKLLYIWAK